MITIDSEKCVRCGQCVFVCPTSLIRQSQENSVPLPIKRAEEFCIGCGHCVASCDVGAVNVDAVRGEKNESFSSEWLPTFDQLATLLKTRRSIRHFQKNPVSEAKICQLLDVVRWAPSAKNGLPVKWLVVNSPDVVRELAGLVIEWLRPQEQARHLIKTWDAGLDMIHRGAPCLIAAYTDPDAMWADIDVAIAVETMDIATRALDLGSCWAGYFTRASQNEPKIGQRLGLLPGQIIRGGLMIGEIDREIYHQIPYRPEVNVRWVS